MSEKWSLDGHDLFAFEKGKDEAEKEETSRAFIDQLIADTHLYDSANALKELLDFTVRLRNIAPFNVMLLHIQKPGLSHAARAKDWWERFQRKPKPYARPLMVLRTFGPVDFVYDILDTEGPPLPDSAFSFPTDGEVPSGYVQSIDGGLGKIGIRFTWLDRGDHSAGHARKLSRHGDKSRYETFELGINSNHPDPVQVVTIAHEMAHIYLGHCGADEKRRVKYYRPEDIGLREVEAETVAYLVAKRTGLAPRSESYLEKYKGAFDRLDLHRILKTASAVEREMKLPFPNCRIF